MSRIVKFFKAIGDWMFVGKRFPIILASFILIAIAATITTVSILNKPEDELVTVFVTVKGLGEKDFENRQIRVKDSDTLAQIFSLEYKEIYNDFGKPFVYKNEFYSLLGVEKTAQRGFHVTIDGIHNNNLSNAYVYENQTVVISYY